MKANSFLLTAILFVTVILVLITGCEYNVSEPLWYQPYNAAPSPVISQVIPSEATPGVNTITIEGVNFKTDTSTTWVNFDNTPAEILSITTNSITVRRPNIASDSCKIKIIPHNAIEEAIYSPYKVSKVMEKYGGFLAGAQLGIVAVDNQENLYVVETISKDIHKVTPAGDNTLLKGTGNISKAPYDGKIGPDGNLYVTENNRAVDKVDLATGDVTRWTQLPSGKVVRFCDFGSNGFFYAGGAKTGIVILPFDLSADATVTTDYTSDEIEAIRFYNDYLYVVSKPNNSVEPVKIYKHAVNQDGSIGTQEEVFDMNSIGDSSVVIGLTFGSDGKMFIATNSAGNAMRVVDPSGSVDTFYKGILRPYCVNIYWGSGDYLYMINGDTIAGEEWTVYRINMGQAGAPYY